MANRVDSANRWFAPRFARSGAFGTGSWTDTSPPKRVPYSNLWLLSGNLLKIQKLAANHFPQSAAQ